MHCLLNAVDEVHKTGIFTFKEALSLPSILTAAAACLENIFTSAGDRALKEKEYLATIQKFIDAGMTTPGPSVRTYFDNVPNIKKAREKSDS